MMKVVVISTYPPAVCGIAHCTRDLFSELAKQEVDVVVAANEGAKASEGIEVLDVWKRNSIPSIPKIFYSTIKENPDITHIQFIHGLYGGSLVTIFFLIGMFILKCMGKKVVLRLHEVTALSRIKREYLVMCNLKLLLPLGKAGIRLLSLTIYLVNKVLVSLSDHVLVTTAEMKEILVKEYGINARKISILPLGVKRVGHVDREEAKKEMGLNGCFVIMHFGIIRKGKGLELVIKAMPEIADIRNAVFVLVGAPENAKYIDHLHKLVQEYGVKKKVIFVTEYINGVTAAHGWLSAADVLVYTYYEYTPAEGASAAFSNALMFGKPALVSDFHRLRETARLYQGIGTSDFVITGATEKELVNKIVRALTSDKPLMKRVSKALEEIAAERTYDKIAQKMLQTYGEVLRKGR